MTKASVQPCLYFIFLLHGLQTVFALHHPAHSMYAAERNWVLHCSAHDPCSRGGLWIAIDGAAKARAKDECEMACDDFIFLTVEEQRSCPDAREPKCLSGFGCGPFDFKCTFECRTVAEVWRRQDGGSKRLERVLRTVWKPKDLKTIAATVVEPRIIPPGAEPYVINRGKKRRYG